MKPGYQTSEFWLTLLSQALALLVLTGGVSAGDKDKLETALANAVTAVCTLVASASVVWQYVQSRTSLKRQQQNVEAASNGIVPPQTELPF
jgi:hypothetical protein